MRQFFSNSKREIKFFTNLEPNITHRARRWRKIRKRFFKKRVSYNKLYFLKNVSLPQF